METGGERWIRPTIREVAKQAGVSISTVSRVLNQKEDLVLPDTRKRVWAAVHALDYSPSRAARTLRTHGSGVIGAIVPDLANPYYSLLIRGAQEEASEEGAALLVCGSSQSKANEVEALDLLYDEGVRGVILLSANEKSESAIQRLLRARIPVVAVHRHVDGVPLVAANICSGGYKLASHLLDVGYRKLAIIAGAKDLSTFLSIQTGVSKALAERSLKPAATFHGDFSYSFGYNCAIEILQQGKADAILAQNDMMAMGAMNAADDFGVDVPCGLGVSGFGQVPWAWQMRPKLTTVYLPFVEMGREAMRQILMIEDGGDTAAQLTLLETRLVVGQTTSR